MKAKILSIAISIFTLFSFVANGQTVSGQQDYTGGFTGIEIGDHFKATLKIADYYGVEWTVDEALKNFMHVYLKGNTLVATVDRKSFDKDTKKLYSGKKADAAVMRVVIYAPEISTIVASDDAVVDAADFNIQPDVLTVETSDNSVVKGLTVTASSVTFSASKKSVISDAVIDAGNMSVNSFNSASVELDQVTKNLSLQVNGTSSMNVVGETETLDVTVLNSSKLTMKGTAVSVSLKAGGKEIHAEELKAEDVSVIGSNSCKAYINVTDNLSLDLKGGCLVSFDGKPVIDIVNIQNSSVSHLGQ